MLVTIKNGKRTLKLTKRELDTLEAAHGIISGVARDYAEDEQAERFETAAHGLSEIAGCAAASEPEKPTKRPAPKIAEAGRMP